MTHPLVQHAVYLAGDSYPSDAPFERDVQKRFGPLALSWTGQGALIERSGEAQMVRSIDARVAGLEHLLADDVDRTSVVLFGRSSGARTATRFASARPVRAVVCFAYPFRKPNKPAQPNRYRHLASLAAPTLIFQGVDDEYGGVSVAQDYALSQAIALRFVKADHKMQLDADGWSYVERETRAFLTGLA